MIDTYDALSDLMERALEEEVVAVDTEFVWERTYYPQLGLVQLAFSEEETFLIDTVAIDDLSPLGRILSEGRVEKILHDAVQDLVILRRVTGAYPENIFDTQAAAGLVGLASTISLAGLLWALVEVDLPKTQTRTNWLRRPLSSEQQVYAHNDVRYMPAARDILLERIRSLGRETWLDEELDRYDDPSLYEEKDPHEQFDRISGSGRLSARELAVLRELAAWREEEARHQDRPRGHIVADNVLVEIARRSPRNEDDLRRVRGSVDHRRYGRDVLEAVERGLEAPADERPLPAGAQPRPDEPTLARVDLALAYVKGKSLGEAVDPAMIGSRADISAVVMEAAGADPAQHALLRGWRGEFIGQELLRILAGEVAVRVDPKTGLPSAA